MRLIEIYVYHPYKSFLTDSSKTQSTKFGDRRSQDRDHLAIFFFQANIADQMAIAIKRSPIGHALVMSGTQGISPIARIETLLFETVFNVSGNRQNILIKGHNLENGNR